jgi:hypothetical protein
MTAMPLLQLDFENVRRGDPTITGPSNLARRDIHPCSPLPAVECSPTHRGGAQPSRTEHQWRRADTSPGCMACIICITEIAHFLTQLSAIHELVFIWPRFPKRLHMHNRPVFSFLAPSRHGFTSSAQPPVRLDNSPPVRGLLTRIQPLAVCDP